MRIKLHLLLLLLGLLPMVFTASAADEVVKCIVCGEMVKPGQKYYVYEKHPALAKPVYICSTCNELKIHCAKCGLPVKETAEKTEDGRYFCPICYPLLALDADEIRQMFKSAANELARMSNGKMLLKNQTITVNVFDVDYWNSKIGDKSKGGMQRHGLSTSRPSGDGLVHTVLLYRGLWKDEMVAVCAHEYTHLWINENKPESRVIEPHTLEAVCEVVALALMEQLQLPGQVKSIMENDYTEGRIKPAAAYYKVHGLNSVLDWVIDGQQPTFDERDFQTSSQGSSASAVWKPPGQAYKQEFDSLHLKGVIGTKEKAVALINDKTFVKGEVRTLDVAGQKKQVKLLEILEDSVLVQLGGGGEPVKLFRE